MGRFFISVLFVSFLFLITPAESFGGDCETGRKYGDVNTQVFSSCDLKTTCFLFWSNTGCAKVKCEKGQTIGAYQNKCVIAGANGGTYGPTKEYAFEPGGEVSFDFRCKDMFSVYYGEAKFTSIKYEGGGCPDRLGLRAK